MTKAFVKKVLDSGFVDTRCYRYAAKYNCNRYEIWRIPIEKLGTSAAYNGTGWKLVKMGTRVRKAS